MILKEKLVYVAYDKFTEKYGDSMTVKDQKYILNMYSGFKNGKDLMQKCLERVPDVIVADMFLDEVDILTIINTAKSIKKNSIVIAVGPKNRVFIDTALRNGCDYYLGSELNKESLLSNIRMLLNSKDSYADDVSGIITSDEYIDAVVDDVLSQIFGIPYSVIGFSFLKEAISYVLRNTDASTAGIAITKEIYPEVAKKFNSTSSRVERNIRTAIEKAYTNAGPDVIEEYFGKSYREFDEKPTNTHFIMTVCRKILSKYTFKRG